jgi:hypothetical protein
MIRQFHLNPLAFDRRTDPQQDLLNAEFKCKLNFRLDHHSTVYSSLLPVLETAGRVGGGHYNRSKPDMHRKIEGCGAETIWFSSGSGSDFQQVSVPAPVQLVGTS